MQQAIGILRKARTPKERADARRAENEQARKVVENKRGTELRSRYPSIHRVVNHPDFQTLFEARTGFEWDRALEDMPDACKQLIDIVFTQDVMSFKQKLFVFCNSSAFRSTKLKVSSRTDIYAQCTPRWADTKKISQIYKKRRLLNEAAGEIAFHVDHIVPVNSEKVCGLHWEENLRVVPAKENLKKSNKIIDGLDEEDLEDGMVDNFSLQSYASRN